MKVYDLRKIKGDSFYFDMKVVVDYVPIILGLNIRKLTDENLEVYLWKCLSKVIHLIKERVHGVKINSHINSERAEIELIKKHIFFISRDISKRFKKENA